MEILRLIASVADIEQATTNFKHIEFAADFNSLVEKSLRAAEVLLVFDNSKKEKKGTSREALSSAVTEHFTLSFYTHTCLEFL